MFKSVMKILKRPVLKQFASYDPGDLQKTFRMQDGVSPRGEIRDTHFWTLTKDGMDVTEVLPLLPHAPSRPGAITALFATDTSMVSDLFAKQGT